MARRQNLALVAVESTRPAAPDALPLLTITKTELLVGNDVIANVASGPLGFDAAIKRAGQRAALQILPLDTALRPLHDCDPNQNRIRLLLDATTSYRAMLEVLFTASQAGFTSFEFIVMTKAGERAVAASTPSRAERNAAREPGAIPSPSFIFDADGATISVGDVPIGAGCVKGAPGIAVPGKLDGLAIASCASRLKSLTPAWSALTTMSISAASGLEIQTILAIVAQLVPTFPSVHFGLLSG